MPKVQSIYICQQCGYHYPQFLGKCPECGEWNSFVEQVSEGNKRQVTSNKLEKAQIINLADVEKIHYQRVKTGIEEFDRVLGGGIVNGSLILVAGDPGIGKSTLLTQVALNIARGPARAAAPPRLPPRALSPGISPGGP